MNQQNSSESNSTGLGDILQLIYQLLGDPGCAWDKKQTLQSLSPHLIEEAYEVVAAINKNDIANHKEELGDLLFQIVFQTVLQERAGTFDIYEVCKDVVAKMKYRHPHVFQTKDLLSIEEVSSQWEKLKKEEKGTKPSILGKFESSMPALLNAQKLGESAALVGFDWKKFSDTREKLTEELNELDEAIHDNEITAIEHELGDVLFVLTRIAAKLNLSAELALQKASWRFIQRFNFLEQQVALDKQSFDNLSLEQLNKYWHMAKENEKNQPK